MSLTSVKMSEEVWMTCVAHALTTETEEIMGLLFGDIHVKNSDNVTALIWGASPQMRSERKKDRVEVNPELLAAASAQAERMGEEIGRTTRVIGWYHSHPHITVFPSHVDVGTQANYQLMEQGFIGLIFSCFSEDAQKVGRIEVIAFQSLGGQGPIVPIGNCQVVDVESSWGSLDSEPLPVGHALPESVEQDTGDSRVAKLSKVWGRSSDMDTPPHAGLNKAGKQPVGENSLVVYNPDNINDAAADLEDSEMTPSLQEALHLSNMEMSGAEYKRKEVPLLVVPARHILRLDAPLASYVDVQHVLFEEERSAYNQAIQQNMHDGKINPVAYFHHTSTYNASLCKLMEYCLSPAIIALEDRLKENETRLSSLMDEHKQLEAEISSRSGGGTKVESPRRLPHHGNSGSTASVPRDARASADQASSRSPRSSGSRRRPS